MGHLCPCGAFGVHGRHVLVRGAWERHWYCPKHVVDRDSGNDHRVSEP